MQVKYMLWVVTLTVTLKGRKGGLREASWVKYNISALT